MPFVAFAIVAAPVGVGAAAAAAVVGDVGEIVETAVID